MGLLFPKCQSLQKSKTHKKETSKEILPSSKVYLDIQNIVRILKHINKNKGHENRN